jgi:ABC-2 type transport system permease protein
MSELRTSALSDVKSCAMRSLRNLRRDPEAVIPPLIIGAFFYAVNLGALTKLTEAAGPEGFSFESFQLPTAVLFGITGLSRALTIVNDIQNGYLDRLLATPIRRWAILAGSLTADFVLAVGLTVPIVIIGYIVGVRFETGVIGIVLFVVMAAMWSMAFATGNAAAVGNAFLLFFPFAFLTTAQVPLEQLSGWLKSVARFNPMTYLLQGLRSLISEGWNVGHLLSGLGAIGGVGALSFTLAIGAMRRRVSSK